MRIPPLMLGTVQVGMPYGIGAARGGIGAAEAEAILDEAWARGVRALDTARAYGEAEAVIGRWLRARKPAPAPFIVSKFPPLAAGGGADAVARALDATLRELNLGRIDLYLAHRGADLLEPGIADALAACVAGGKIGAYGASIYDAAEGQSLLGIEGLSALQLPLHLANTEAADSGLLEAAARRGIAVFARSVFLQGLLLAAPDALDPHLAAAAPALRTLEQLAQRSGTTRAALALAAVRTLPSVASIVVGVDSAAQLREILAAEAQLVDPQAVAEALAIGRSFPRTLADPRHWKQ